MSKSLAPSFSLKTQEENSAFNSPNNENAYDTDPHVRDESNTGNAKRTRVRTQKGLSYELTKAKQRQNKASYRLKTIISELDNLLREECDIVKLSAQKHSLEIELNKISSLRDTVTDLLDDLNETEDDKNLDSLIKNALECLADANLRIDDLKQERLEQRSVRSSSSARLRASVTPSPSNHLEKQDKASSEAAAARAKLEILSKQQELERKQEELARQQRELQQLKEHISLQRELSAADAIKNILKEPRYDEDEQTRSEVPQNRPNAQNDLQTRKQGNESQAYFDVHAPEFFQGQYAYSTPAQPSFQIPPDDISYKFHSIQVENSKIQRSQVELLQRLSLPVPKPPVFTGDILSYPRWEGAFDSLIVENCIKPSHKLYYLGEYTDGLAQKMIQGLLGLRSEDAYNRARRTLKERFGNPYRIYEAYRQKLMNWKICVTGTDLIEFSDFLIMTQETMRSVKYLNEFNNLTSMRQLAARLPTYYCNKWRDSAKKIEGSREYRFTDFVEFVSDAATDATHPVFSQESLNVTKREIERSITTSKVSPSIRKPHVIEKPQSRGIAFNISATDAPRARTCPCCENSHSIEECKEFLNKDIVERKEFAKSNRLCFRCLKKGHTAKQCRGRQRCKTCGRSHATSLHDDSLNSPATERTGDPPTPLNKDTPNARATSNCINAHQEEREDSPTTSLILPVWLHHCQNPDIKVEVYAILDDQSDVCFVANSVCETLGLCGPDITLELSTMHAVENVKTQRITGLVVERQDRKVNIPLPKVYTREAIPSRKEQIPTPKIAANWKHLQRIADKLHPFRDDLPIGILIGNNCVQAIKPRDVIPGNSKDPYAIRTTLGWGIIGPVSASRDLCKKEQPVKTETSEAVYCHRTISQETPGSKFVPIQHHKEVMSPETVRALLEMDFKDSQASGKPISQEDIRFLEIMKNGIHLTEDNHYEMPLPLRDEQAYLPCNRRQVEIRLQQLKRRLQRDQQYRDDYTNFMEDMIKKGYAEEAPKDVPARWYIPHHGVYNPRKPGKIRVVFDCSAEFQGHSLNRRLMQGPDMTNSLLGVLCRFRQEPTAFAGDIEGMFHQVRVNAEHRDFLRFLWWKNGDISQHPQEYRMTVHLFGSASSPSCANLALKTTADDNEAKLGQDAANVLRKNFYVDDGLKSVRGPDEAIDLIKRVKKMCQQGGFRLHKFTSNSKMVIDSIPKEDRATGMKNIDLDKQPLPMERVLGVEWCVENDSLQFRIVLKDKPFTRRGILATVSSIYDPLGLAAPFLLKGKRILQLLCKDNVGWDDQVPEEIKPSWDRWRSELHLLEKLAVPRCYVPNGFAKIARTELHHFSDASNEGYGQCSYLRIIDVDGQIQCALVMGKARVAPLKPFTVPRLELTAALVSVRTSEVISQELEYDVSSETFWTDSMVVKAYIENDARRFHTFVANRVQQIRDRSNPNQWMYVPTEQNPADDASRGLSATELTSQSRWLNGPAFLRDSKERWNDSTIEQPAAALLPDDKEVKRGCTLMTTTAEIPTLTDRLSYFSSWSRAIKAVAYCLRYVAILRAKIQARKRTADKANELSITVNPITTEELKSARLKIIRDVQNRAFTEDITALNQSRDVKKSNRLERLNPFIDQEGSLRVGGRLKHSSMPEEVKHPLILPRCGPVTEMILRYYHEKTYHQGRNLTINELRTSGIWVIGCSSAVSELLHKCTTCRKLRAETQKQKMADLPPERLSEEPPFTYSGVDYFGPWIVKNGRKECKRYGVVFTCMASRAIHLEVAHTLESDSFINALRRFICRRGPVRQLQSDRGTNFVGATRELKEAMAEMDHEKISSEALEMNCDWVITKMNPPSASHMGGVWERQIRSVRSVLNYLLQRNGSQLNDEALVTFMCEAEAIINSRPLTTDNLNQPDSLEPLTPNHILTMKSKIVLPPPGTFQAADKYSRRMWRRVQHLANEFWTRWRNEFLLSLQQRSKWCQPKKNVSAGDIVIIKDEDLPRNAWKLGRVIEAHAGKDNLVRTVKVAVGDRHLHKNGKRSKPLTVLDRPIHKLVLLLPKAKTGDREPPSESH